jgi:hypothetical protein
VATFKQLVDAGADVVGGIVYLDRKEVGRFANSEFLEEPGMEDFIAEHSKRKASEKAVALENAKVYAESVKAPAKVGEVTKVDPETTSTISDADAATAMNSIPGAGPQNPVREDAENNRSPNVEPTPAEELLRALGNPEGAAKVAEGKEAAGNTGTELKAGSNARPTRTPTSK